MNPKRTDELFKLRKEIGILKSSVKILTADNERKTKELARIRGLVKATGNEFAAIAITHSVK